MKVGVAGGRKRRIISCVTTLREGSGCPIKVNLPGGSTRRITSYWKPPFPKFGYLRYQLEFILSVYH